MGEGLDGRACLLLLSATVAVSAAAAYRWMRAGASRTIVRAAMDIGSGQHKLLVAQVRHGTSWYGARPQLFQ